MESREEFFTDWNARFPACKPPDLSCFASDKVTKTGLVESLRLSKQRVDQLTEELRQEEFIAAFLHEKLHHSALINGVTEEETEDLDSPIPAFQEPNKGDSQQQVTITENNQAVLYTNLDSQQQTTINTAATAYTGVSTFKPVNNTAKHNTAAESHDSLHERLSKDIKCSTLQFEPSHRSSFTADNSLNRHSLKKSYSEPRSKDSGEAGTGTRDRKSINKPPVPAPRPSIKGPSTRNRPAGSYIRTESTESADSVSLDSNSNPEQGDSGTDSPGLTPSSSPQVNKAPPLLRPLKNVKMKDTIAEDSNCELKTYKKKSPSASPKASPRMAHRKRPSARHVNAYATVDIDFTRKITLLDDDSVKSGDDLNSTPEEDIDYDNPVPVNMDGIPDDSSSEDEEPVYLNIMLMKKQSMSSLNPSNIYSTVNIGKKSLDPSHKLDITIEDAPPLPPKTSIGDHDESSSKESTPSGNAVFVYPSSDDKTDNGAPEEHPSWRRRSSMKKAFEGETASVGSASSEADDVSMRLAQEGETASIYSISSEPDELDQMVPSTEAQEKLTMRKWVVTSILDSEHNYVSMLDVLLQYMRSLQAAATTSQPLISKEEIDVIFQEIPALHKIHADFIRKLEPKVESWSEDQEIAECFKMMSLNELPVLSEYLKNYQRALAQIQKCAAENPQFSEIIQNIKWKGSNETATLEELLHKPVVRIQRNTLVLHDLIKCTPTSHTDYDILQKTLKITHHFLENFQCPMVDDNADHQRYLVKNNLLVEKVGNNRKLRQLFLFNDVLVCTKQKLAGRQRLHFDVKWFIPLRDMTEEIEDNPHEGKGQGPNIDNLQKRVSGLQSELRTEIKRNKAIAEGRNWSIRGGSAGKNLEKIKKKLAEQEEQLMLQSPQLVFRLKNRTGKTFTLLMSSDYERNSWKETIHALKQKGHNIGNLSPMELQNHINNLKLPKLNALSSVVDDEDWEIEQEHLFGALNITLHRLQGLTVAADTYCCMEVDSYNHFFMRAKTKLCCASIDPVWNEDFEIDLDGAQTLRILCYKSGGQSDTLLGKCALELSKAWLRGDFQEKTISLNEDVSLIISLSYASRDQTIKRTPSSVKTGLFGVRISQVCKREGNKIPIIVRACVEEVEQRGLDDVGIYRVSGLSSEIQRMKKGFEKGARGMVANLKECDINVVTGLLKLYLRELPEALFTDKLYASLIEGNSLSDPEAKQKCMLSLMRALPEPNYTVAMFLIDHLVTVSKMEDQNKMSIQNLATVFGPTLLRPAARVATSSADLFSLGAQDAMMQTSILYYFLTLRLKGADFSK